ncbi:NADPH-dependent 7-cyano-7-deazaguanine reductase QueF [Paraferrimonas haliotis]|nr:NADPH-dependent 7-cyano-7-deazaguanine reductase QueF [Paraferrimonas haliotis]
MTQKPSPYDNASELTSLTLGQQTEYKNTYDASVLQGVPRSLNRDAINLSGEMPFTGTDLWTGYELSWLTNKGLPQVAILQVSVPCNSPNLIESKSFKLYLNTLNQTRFSSVEALQTVLLNDLSACAGKPVTLSIIKADQFASETITKLEGDSIDEQDISIDDYLFNPDHLLNSTNEHEIVQEKLTSDLLKSNCLITSQPDWGSVQIHYRGPRINQEKLLRYLISFREHNEFHEQCVERIFTDLSRYCGCEKLTVYARYTRRGGLDINPFRSNFEAIPNTCRLARQ